MKNTNAFLLIFLIIQAYPLRFSHFELKSQLEGSSSNAADAFSRLIDFLLNQSTNLETKGMTHLQKENILKFYANDPYFCEMLINEALKSSSNRWIRQLSPEGQKFYLLKITNFSKSQLQDSEKLGLLQKQLRQDDLLGNQFKKIEGKKKEFINKQSSSWLLKFL